MNKRAERRRGFSVGGQLNTDKEKSCTNKAVTGRFPSTIPTLQNCSMLLS